MADWVHCNLCFHQPGDGRKFSLTNCGHIYCELCLREGTVEKCKMCGSSCSSIALSSQMKPDVEIFFSDPADIIQKQRKQLIQIMEFQKNHRRRLNTYIRDKLSKQREMIEMSQKNTSQFQVIERQIMNLKEENLYLKKLIHDKGIGGSQRPGTPGNRLSSSPGGYRASPGSHPQNGSPLYRTSSSTPGSQRFQSGDVPRNTPIKSTNLQQMVSRTPPSSLGRVTIRTPPINGKIGPVMSTPSPRHTAQMTGIRGSTPGAGEALRNSFATPQPSPKPMFTGTPQAIQVPITRESSMSQYRHALRTSPGFAIHTPRGADLVDSLLSPHPQEMSQP